MRPADDLLKAQRPESGARRNAAPGAILLGAWLASSLGLAAHAQRTNEAAGAASPPPAPAPAPKAPSRPDLTTFRIITDRNIFNAARSGGTPRFNDGPRRQRRVDAFTLVGTLDYEKGTFAFFDGSSQEYRKSLQRGGSIAAYRLLAVEPNQVRLAVGTNQPVALRVGMQMRREEDGDWQLSDRSESYANSGPGTSSENARTTAPSTSSSGAEESDVVKRLMAQREKENK
jgi:hypothetical protein